MGLFSPSIHSLYTALNSMAMVSLMSKPAHGRQQSRLIRAREFEELLASLERLDRLLAHGVEIRSDLSAAVNDAVVNDDLGHARVVRPQTLNVVRHGARGDDSRTTGARRRGRTRADASAFDARGREGTRRERETHCDAFEGSLKKRVDASATG